jgi:hypothetical protein
LNNGSHNFYSVGKTGAEEEKKDDLQFVFGFS